MRYIIHTFSVDTDSIPLCLQCYRIGNWENGWKALRIVALKLIAIVLWFQSLRHGRPCTGKHRQMSRAAGLRHNNK